MKPFEIVILVVAILIVVFTIVYNLVRRLKGKGPSCSCGSGSCSSCSSCPSCRAAVEEKNKDIDDTAQDKDNK